MNENSKKEKLLEKYSAKDFSSENIEISSKSKKSPLEKEGRVFVLNCFDPTTGEMKSFNVKENKK